MASPQPRFVDVSTVISMLPYPIAEKKPGLTPGQFPMKAAEDDDIELLIVERCHHPVYIDETRPRLIVPDPSDIVAHSIVMDHKSAMIGYKSGEAEPGLGWVPGAYENNSDGKRALAAAYPDLLNEMRELQMNWYRVLLAQADDDWAKYRQHKFITPIQRKAAQFLGQTNRDWMLNYQIEQSMSKCRFCFTQVHPLAIICPSCHGVLDAVRYKEEFTGTGQIEKVAPKA